jgi:hypothetical protein
MKDLASLCVVILYMLIQSKPESIAIMPSTPVNGFIATTAAAPVDWAAPVADCVELPKAWGLALPGTCELALPENWEVATPDARELATREEPTGVDRGLLLPLTDPVDQGATKAAT